MSLIFTRGSLRDLFLTGHMSTAIWRKVRVLPVYGATNVDVCVVYMKVVLTDFISVTLAKYLNACLSLPSS
jgi:hypothetical protein